MKIYETVQLTMFYVFFKSNIHVKFANVLWVAFSIPSDSLSPSIISYQIILGKYNISEFTNIII
jgi:hypothetical protein